MYVRERESERKETNRDREISKTVERGSRGQRQLQVRVLGE